METITKISPTIPDAVLPLDRPQGTLGLEAIDLKGGMAVDKVTKRFFRCAVRIKGYKKRMSPGETLQEVHPIGYAQGRHGGA